MKNFTLLFFALLIQATASAHYLWVETNPTGKLNKTHEVKVRYGEYTYGAIENTDSEAFEKVNNFKLWLLNPSGEKIELQTEKGKDYYYTQFTPEEKGAYTVILNNDLVDVLDYTEYDFGIFKPQYHAKATVYIGNANRNTKKSTNEKGLELINLTQKAFKKGTEVNLKVLFKEEILKEQEVVISISDLWSKTLTTDENGEISFVLPWDQTLYTIETTYNEGTPGKFNDEEYEFIWHCATYAINL